MLVTQCRCNRPLVRARNEVVETAKAGDKIVFTGTVIVLPETAGSSQ